MATINTDEYYTTAVAAKKIGGISTDTVTRYCMNHEEGRTPAIEAVKYFGKWLIHKDEISRFKKARQPVGRPTSDK